MMQTLDDGGQITPVDVLMIVQVTLCLNIIIVTPYYMRRYKLHEGVIVSLLTYYSGHVGAYGKMSGRKSLCTTTLKF
ncbi:MAG: hypothetical protein U9N61_05965 [Euryarchaeota archaeon]|nr:hypothetical protein [Euryarchaeota archaeon]